jgi:hypothetical protein
LIASTAIPWNIGAVTAAAEAGHTLDVPTLNLAACYPPGMKNAFVFASVFAACLTLGAQDDANIKLPKDPAAILEMAAPFYNFDSATAKPFHLSYLYHLLDNQGNVSAEGKVEYWWSPGNVSRVSWTKGNNVHSEWRTADGKTLQSVKGDDITSMEHRLSSAVLFSLPKAQDYESGETSL